MLNKLRHHWNVSSRRDFFSRAGSGLASIALASMFNELGYRTSFQIIVKRLPKSGIGESNACRQDTINQVFHYEQQSVPGKNASTSA